MDEIREAVKAVGSASASPAALIQILEGIAQDCHEAQGECSANWQDDGAGYPWEVIARELDKAVTRINKAVL